MLLPYTLRQFLITKRITLHKPPIYGLHYIKLATLGEFSTFRLLFLYNVSKPAPHRVAAMPWQPCRRKYLLNELPIISWLAWLGVGENDAPVPHEPI